MMTTSAFDELRTLEQHRRMINSVFTVFCEQLFDQLVTNRPNPITK